MTDFRKELKQEEKQWTEDSLQNMLGNLRRQGGILQIDEEKKIIKIWQEDLRLLKPVPRIFISGLCRHFGYTFQLKEERS